MIVSFGFGGGGGIVCVFLLFGIFLVWDYLFLLFVFVGVANLLRLEFSF